MSSGGQRSASAASALACALAAAVVAADARADEPLAPRRKRAPSVQVDEELDAKFTERDEKLDSWAFEELRVFFGVYVQDGQGYQSQAEPMVDGKGSEEAWIIEPMASFRFRTNDRLDHTITFPVDVVSAASPDATDLTSSASRVNQSLALDISSTYKLTPWFDFGFHWGPHFEEPYRSFYAGPSFRLHLFEDNTIFGLNGTVTADAFDPIQPDGRDLGQRARVSLTGNASYSQVLSPTTVLDLSVAMTTQSGTLETTYNSILAHDVDAIGFDDAQRVGEVFPTNRFRGAALARVSQHVPATHSTVKAMYRYYHDENDVTAHTGELEISQYIVPWLYLRAHGRLYTQTPIAFWSAELPAIPAATTKRTADSDLSGFVSREAGLHVVLVRDRAPKSFRGPDSFDLGYVRYQRSNGLHVDFASFGYARTFE